MNVMLLTDARSPFIVTNLRHMKAATGIIMAAISGERFPSDALAAGLLVRHQLRLIRQGVFLASSFNPPAV